MKQYGFTIAVVSLIVLVAIGANLANAKTGLIGFSTAPSAPSLDGLDPEANCKASLTRSFVVDASKEKAIPQEVGLKFPASMKQVVSRTFSGWTLDGLPIITVGTFRGQQLSCEGTTASYPFNYESCVCPIDGNSECVCPTLNVDWRDEPNATPTDRKYGLHHVLADPSHYYFQGEHPMTGAGHLFRINVDGSDLKMVAGAGGHAAHASPTLEDVYFIENHAFSPSQPASCITVRAGQAPDGDPQNFIGYCGARKNVYAKWSQDGSHLAFATQDYDVAENAPLRVLVLPMDTQSKTVIRELTFTLTGDIYCSGIAHNSSLITWATKPDRIYFATCPNANARSDIVEVMVGIQGRGTVRPITELQQPEVPFKMYPAVSPDSSHLAYIGFSPGFEAADIFVQDLELASKPKALLNIWEQPNRNGSKVRFLLNPHWQP